MTQCAMPNLAPSTEVKTLPFPSNLVTPRTFLWGVLGLFLLPLGRPTGRFLGRGGGVTLFLLSALAAFLKILKNLIGKRFECYKGFDMPPVIAVLSDANNTAITRGVSVL